jgi:carbon storage regulator
MESLLIGSDVEITVLRIERNQVRLGIVAPGQVTILRAELLAGEKKDNDVPLPQEKALSAGVECAARGLAHDPAAT